MDDGQGWSRFMGDYTTDPHRAMDGEPEPVDDDWLKLFVADARAKEEANGA